MQPEQRERDLFDDSSVVLLPLSGHTPGTIGALISLDRDGQFLLASESVSLDRTSTPIPRHEIPADQAALKSRTNFNILPRPRWAARDLSRGAPARTRQPPSIPTPRRASVRQFATRRAGRPL